MFKRKVTEKEIEEQRARKREVMATEARHNEMAKKEREELISLLRQQMALESKAVTQYSEGSKEVESSAVKHILHTIQLDSMKHMDVCQLIIDVLQGEDVLKNEKEEIFNGLKRHLDIEKDSLNIVKKIERHYLIRNNKGFQELVKRWKNDEKEHHKALKNLVNKTFFTIDRSTVFMSKEKLEARYVGYKRAIARERALKEGKSS